MSQQVSFFFPIMLRVSWILSPRCPKWYSLKAWVDFNCGNAHWYEARTNTSFSRLSLRTSFPCSFLILCFMFPPASFLQVVPSNILWKPGSITVHIDSQGPAEHVFTVVSLAHFFGTNSWEKTTLGSEDQESLKFVRTDVTDGISNVFTHSSTYSGDRYKIIWVKKNWTSCAISMI